MYRAFPQKEYGQRAKIETIFSVIKRKLSSRAPGRSLPVQIRQALLLGLTYNLYRLRHRLRLRGCQQSHPLPLIPVNVMILNDSTNIHKPYKNAQRSGRAVKALTTQQRQSNHNSQIQRADSLGTKNACPQQAAPERTRHIGKWWQTDLAR